MIVRLHRQIERQVFYDCKPLKIDSATDHASRGTAGQRFALVGSLPEKLVQEKGDTVFTFTESSNRSLEVGNTRVR